MRAYILEQLTDGGLSYLYHKKVLGWQVYWAWRRPWGGVVPCFLNDKGLLVNPDDPLLLPVSRKEAISALRSLNYPH